MQATLSLPFRFVKFSGTEYTAHGADDSQNELTEIYRIVSSKALTQEEGGVGPSTGTSIPLSNPPAVSFSCDLERAMI
jgi:hypothetical protein